MNRQEEPSYNLDDLDVAAIKSSTLDLTSEFAVSNGINGKNMFIKMRTLSYKKLRQDWLRRLVRNARPVLEQEFQKSANWSSELQCELASRLSLPQSRVAKWLRNRQRREMRLRRASPS